MIEDPREEILSKYEGMVYMYARRYAYTESHIEDLAIEGKLGILRGMDKYGTESMEYIHGSITSGMIDYIRKTTHRGKDIKPLTLEWCDLPSPDETEQVDNDIILSDAIKTLTPNQKRIIKAALKGLRHHQIAKVLGVSQASVKQSYDWAVKKMRKHYSV